MQHRFLVCLLVLAALLTSCGAPAPTGTLSSNLGITQPAPSSSQASLSSAEPAQTDEEEQTQVNQMDKTQVSNTYAYLKQLMQDGSFYLQVSRQRQSLTSTFTLAVHPEKGVYIKDHAAGFIYLYFQGTLTVLNESKKEKTSFDVGDSEFSYENFFPWIDFETYAGVPFTATSAGTKRNPKLTEAFSFPTGAVSFYYYRGALSTVSGTDPSGVAYQDTVKSFSGTSQDSLFSAGNGYSVNDSLRPS